MNQNRKMRLETQMNDKKQQPNWELEMNMKFEHRCETVKWLQFYHDIQEWLRDNITNDVVVDIKKREKIDDDIYYDEHGLTEKLTKQDIEDIILKARVQGRCEVAEVIKKGLEEATEE
jgi:hypothetical protein